jgi:hypothetical protein
MSTATATIEFAIARYGDFGDAMVLKATGDAAPSPNKVGQILNVLYRGRCVAWIEFAAHIDPSEVSAAFMKKADYYIGSRAPEINKYGVEFN